MNAMNEQSLITKALTKIYQAGGVGDVHHKQWVIDQVVRILCDSEDAYNTWVNNYKAGDNGPDTYDWDEGQQSTIFDLTP